MAHHDVKLLEWYFLIFCLFFYLLYGLDEFVSERGDTNKNNSSNQPLHSNTNDSSISLSSLSVNQSNFDLPSSTTSHLPESTIFEGLIFLTRFNDKDSIDTPQSQDSNINNTNDIPICPFTVSQQKIFSTSNKWSSINSKSLSIGLCGCALLSIAPAIIALNVIQDWINASPQNQASNY